MNKMYVLNFSIVLLTAACFGFSHGQRKVSRNAAVGSDGKQAIDFSCPEEFGYYPHPTDCTQYYVCVFGGALLESCTGGLMYSHELQTCDWPRNVGCDASHSSGTQTATARSSPRYNPPPPPVSVTVSSRGQPRHQLPVEQPQIRQKPQDFNNHFTKQKQHQQQLYEAAAEPDLPPVEEIENDRQQRVYRGQPSTIGQVQRDRDALRHTNAIPIQAVRNSKIGVISFGTQQPQPIEPQQYRRTVELDDLTDDKKLNRVRRQVRYSRVHVSNPGQLKSSRYSWSAGPVNGKTTNIRVHPFRPSIPEKPYSSKISAYQSVPVHALLPIIHQSSFEPARSNGSYAYFNINSNLKVPSTVLESPSIESYSYFGSKSTETPIIYNSKQHYFVSSTPSYESTTQSWIPTNGAFYIKKPEQPQSVEETDDFRPPPYYYNHYNKYENIVNPFSDSDFDFDKYLENLDESFKSTTSRPVTRKFKTETTTFSTSSIAIPVSDNDLRSRPQSNKPARIKTPRKQNFRTQSNRLNNDLSDTKKNRLSDHRIEASTPGPVPEQYSPSRPVNIQSAGNTGRALYNTSANTNFDQNQYDPYYALYDDDVELYRDIDYGHNYNTATVSEPPKQQNIYRGTPSPPPQQAPQQQSQQIESVTIASRQPPQYIQQDSYNIKQQQSIYKQPIQDDYIEEEDPSDYQTASRTPGRGDRNDLRFPEPTTTTKKAVATTRTTTTTTTTTTTVRPTTIPIRSENLTRSENSTTPESIFITLSAKPRFSPTPFQTTSQPSDILLKTTTNTSTHYPIQSSPLPSSTPPPNSRFFSLTAGFTLLRPNVEHKDPEHHNERKTTISHPSPFKVTNETRRPFQITDLPTPEKPITIVQLGASTHIRSTESPTKRAIYSKNILNTLDPKETNSLSSAYIHPTTYSVPKNFLEALFHKTTPQGFKLPTTTTTQKSTQDIEYYDYFEEENEANNTIPLLPEHYSRTKDVVISSPSVSDNTIPLESDYNDIKITTQKIEVPNAPDRDRDFDNTQTTQTYKFTSTEREPVQPTQHQAEPEIPSSSTMHPNIIMTTFPTNPGRVSRINPAIKSLTTFRGASGTSKCTGNITLSNVKCNEIQQRQNVRGRGSAHYTSAGEDISNRGTPPSRSRPTLKPSTSIVSKASEFIDIYKYPASRPAPIYPTPQVDKSAAKCRKDVCLLPDCYCGGKDIPGDMDIEQVPQIVLLTFDDSVNDLNKGLYSDLFEKGRVNPNGCPISATFYVSHEWTDYSQVQNLYATGHEIASHTVSHSFGEQFSQKKWNREVAGQREILAAYGGVHLEDVRGMRAPFLSVGGNKMFKMLYDSNFTYDSSMPVYENRPPSWPYTLDYKLFHDCMIPPCPTRSYPGVWEVPMVMWQDLNGGRCSMGDACSNPPNSEGVFKMLMKNFDRHYSTNRAPFGLYYHAAWFTQPHHKDGFIQFLDTINAMKDVYLVTNWQAIQWVRDPTPLSRLGNFPPFQCNYPTRPKKCNNPKVCNLWHKSGVRYMRTCQPCPDIYPWTGKTGIKSSRIDNDIED